MELSLNLQDDENSSVNNQNLGFNSVNADLNEMKTDTVGLKFPESVDSSNVLSPNNDLGVSVDASVNQTQEVGEMNPEGTDRIIEMPISEMPIQINSGENIADSIEEIRTPVDLSKDISSLGKVITREEGKEQLHIDENRHNLFNSREQAVVSLDGVPSAKSLKNVNLESKKDVGFTVNNELQNMQLDLLRTNIYYTKKLYEELHDLKVSIKLQSYFKYMVSGVVMLSVVVSSYYAMKLFSGLFAGTGFGDFFAGLSGQNGGIQANLFGKIASLGSEALVQGSNLDTLKNTLEQVPDAYKEKLSEVVKNFLK